MKRLLATIIAMMLVMGMMPASFAADATADAAQWDEFVFTYGSHGYTSTDYTDQVYVGLWDSTNETSRFNIDSENGYNWGFVGHMNTNKDWVGEDCITWKPIFLNTTDSTATPDTANYTYNPDSTASPYSALVLALDTTVTGSAIPYMTYKTSPYGLIYEVYLLKKPAGAYLMGESYQDPTQLEKIRNVLTTNQSNRLGVIDTYGAVEGERETISFPEYTIEDTDDTYYLIFIPNGKNAAATFEVTSSGGNHRHLGRLNLASFTLIKPEALETREQINHVIDSTKKYLIAAKNVGSNKYWYNAPSVRANPYCSSYRNTLDNKLCFAVQIEIPTAGKYKVTTAACDTSGTLDTTTGAHMKVLFGKAPATFDIDNAITAAASYKHIGWHNSTKVSALGEGTGIERTIPVDQYNSMEPVTGEGNVIIDVPTSGKYCVFLTVDPESQTRNSKKNGTSGAYQFFLFYGVALTPVEDTEQATAQEAYEDIVNEDGNPATEATLTTGNKSFVKILSAKDEEVLYNKEHTAGDTITYTASGDDFLYWAQGMGEYKTVISDNPELSIKAEKGAMYIYAVYAKDENTTEVIFYNGNKAEISRKSYENGAAIKMEALPSMAGFKDAASAWTCFEDGKEYTTENPATASGKIMRFVAKYPNTADETFTVTATNGTADKTTATYGEMVTVTAPLRKDNTLLFNYWTKDGEIVSFNQSYSFRVYKDTTVTAVYKEYKPLAESVRKIILGTRTVGTETAVIAEFINVTDVVEKGIMFGGTSLDDATHKVAMKGTDNFFSVIDDVTGDAKGYAILENGSVIYSK